MRPDRRPARWHRGPYRCRSGIHHLCRPADHLVHRQESTSRRIRTLEIIGRQLSTSSQSTALLGAFALLALLLASLGIYGVLSYAVTQRTKEIGLRMALGASSSEIILSFGKRGLVLTLAGLAAGLLSAGAARLLTALLYGFHPDYAPTATLVSLILLAVAALACFVPAHRASCVDPVVALRNE